MPNIRVNVRRSDCEENDVSASERHLNERAEEMKEEEAQNARCGDDTVVAVDATLEGETSTAAAAGNGVHHHSNGAPARGDGPDSAAPPTVAAGAGIVELDGTETQNGELQEPSELKKQTSMIQAERTDHESWDARTGLGEAGGGWCCWKRSERS